MAPVSLGVLASGRGSNLQSIIDACRRGDIKAEVKVVISDRQDAYALKRAEKHGIDAYYINIKDYQDKAAYETKIVELLRRYNVQLVCLAGYMRLVGPTVLNAFPWRIMNIHPSLLPSFPGLHAQKQALDCGVKVSGCTVHFVDEGMDSGPIILQACVPVYDDDTEDSLAERILEQEHKIYPRAVGLFAEGKLIVRGKKVFIREAGND
ncbi:phosphoribosylglycinamide formyltransferase-1 [Desulfohalotomaculum tongense]|uniref:phosphoribosylglycinamide formyltransferase n=1 Tax=Desulforadius tongensis TaxID=1216062 RepID=UPI0019562623|nr:phosphoribosylglycinamide formyltransferase [Desulforadius tongensis]MBM7854257.1 phosphoribosylglycinamide formyltransferase-1 [Desulforadius tongensis]